MATWESAIRPTGPMLKDGFTASFADQYNCLMVVLGCVMSRDAEQASLHMA